MLSIKKSCAGYEEYFVEEVSVKYYAEGGEQPGQWMGKGAQRLGLVGRVDPGILANLAKGLKPDGTGPLISLSSVRKDHAHVALWDQCFSPPKDVSLIWALYPEVANKVAQCHAKAVATAIDYEQRNAAFTRRGAGGKYLERCDLVTAVFTHGTNRNGEPQLHSHVLTINAGARQGPDGGFGTIASNFLYAQQVATRSVYSATLAQELKRELGVKIVFADAKQGQPADSFKIEGIPDRLRDLMSSRRAEILAFKAKAGLTTPKETEQAVLATRKQKEHLPQQVLRKNWIAATKSLGIDLAELQRAVLPRYEQLLTPVANVKSQAEPTAKKNEAVTQPPQTVATVANGTVPTSDSRPEVTRNKVVPLKPAAQTKEDDRESRGIITPAVKRIPKSSDSEKRTRIIRQQDDHGFASREQASIIESLAKSALQEGQNNAATDRLIDLVLERFDRENPPGKFANFTDRTEDAKEALGYVMDIARKMQEPKGYHIKPEDIQHGVMGKLTGMPQDAALVTLLGKKANIACVEAASGADTSLFIKAIAEEYARAGLKVKALAPTASAANELQTVAQISANTTRQQLWRISPPAFETAKHHAMQILRAAIPIPTSGLDAWRLDKRSVLVVTEAQTMRTTEMKTLLKRADAAGAKVILVGNTKHIGKHEPHNVFSEISHATGSVKLADGAIQAERWATSAARQAAQGDVHGALSHYALAGQLHLSRDQKSAAGALIDHWKKLPKSEQDGKTLIIAATQRDAYLLNRLAHDARHKTNAMPRFLRQRVEGEWVYRGDRVRFHVNHKPNGFKAGDVGTIEKINLSSMTVKLDRTQGVLSLKWHVRVDVPKSAYKYLSLGYAVSATQAQGVTCNRALVLPQAGRTDPRGMAVQLSRARLETQVFSSSRSVGEDLEAIDRVFRKQMQTERLREESAKNPPSSRTKEVEEPNEPSQRKQNARVRI